MKTIIVGGAGFVGKNVQNVSNEKFLIIDNLSSGARVEKFGNTLIKKDYSDSLPDVERWRGEERVCFVFLAGETRVAEAMHRPHDFLDANINKPAKFFLEALRAGDKLILASTCGAIYDGNEMIGPNTVPAPKNFYGVTKLAEEQILAGVCALRNVELNIARFTNIFGKFSEHKKSAIHAFIRAGLANEVAFVNGDGKQSRDFIYATDVANAIVALCHKPRGSDISVEVFASGESKSIIEVCNEIGKTTNLKTEFKENAKLLNTEPRDIVVSKSIISNSFKEATSFANAIGNTVEYYRSH